MKDPPQSPSLTLTLTLTITQPASGKVHFILMPFSTNPNPNPNAQLQADKPWNLDTSALNLFRQVTGHSIAVLWQIYKKLALIDLTPTSFTLILRLPIAEN